MLHKLSQYLNEECVSKKEVSGGCVATAFVVSTAESNRYFVKTGMQSPKAFLCEANGLKALANSQTLCIPKVYFANENFLVLEYIEQAPKEPRFFENFGKQLALMHHQNTTTNFGFFEDNYVGNTPQVNLQTASWELFYREYRLRYQLDLLKQKGWLTKTLASFYNNLEVLVAKVLADSEEPPALLHGDLWGGNYRTNSLGKACIYDPAVYFGHREAELAMTRLFGGFPEAFYQSYQQTYPLKKGWQNREGLYKLYPVLNHVNLFGKSYLQSAESLVENYQKL